MKIMRFEDIESWKEGRDLTKLLYRVTGKGKFKTDFGLKDQICRASVSVISNIAEGFESHTSAEFVRFLVYSRRSASEVKSQLYVALDNGYITTEEFEVLYGKATLVSKLINGFIKYLKANPSRN